ncbi:FAD binding domain-containing protein [Rhodoplanes sp. TEM]|uniref:FAD binding domain-containing protein n=1 Tax=Rhodoplanes tepidamans TaxID=200616 RepID=A0ABT5J414_RHOTP|nr:MULTISPECIES: FAD binding domain-containing protein [Rhodoplanes]MDC7784382.1 FAD binding domain-containing protein [Rhodoplanes tepidamans]MDC7985161.1 FAD binding domain-containing protein [Rhodoplanes sp. TEM]MDQ0354489.1 carbon-monoxide dehydrogenase medium subunit [Rhodoplanes tepidamans]
MKAPAFDYVRPASLDEAQALLAGSDGAKLLAGGQSLGPMLNLRLARPALLVDISRLDVLTEIGEAPEAWRIGAGVTHARLEDLGDRLAGAAMVGTVARGIAYRSVRTRGTIGGSIAHADPAADWPLALVALGASIEIRTHDDTRVQPAERFVRAAFTTDLAADEIVNAVVVPKRSAQARTGYFKFCRKAGEYPLVSAAVVLDRPSGFARIVMGALPSGPTALPDLAETVLTGGAAAATETIVETAVAAAVPGLDPVALRMRASAVRRAILQAYA